jgi:glutaredoxin
LFKGLGVIFSREVLSVVAAVVLVSGSWQVYQRLRDSGTGTEIAKRAKPGDIRMLSSATCVYCVQAKNWFDAHDIPVDECFIETDAACAADYAARGSVGTPMIRVKGRWQTGFLPDRVLWALGTPAASQTQ